MSDESEPTPDDTVKVMLYTGDTPPENPRTVTLPPDAFTPKFTDTWKAVVGDQLVVSERGGIVYSGPVAEYEMPEADDV